MSISRVDSELGYWTHIDWQPRDLAGLVESIWFFAGAATLRRERHFPTGTLDLIVHLGCPADRFRIVEGEPPGRCTATSVGGLLVRPMVIEAPPGPCRVLGVRLTPAGAFALLGLPLNELTDRTVDLCDVVGVEADELAERCDEAPSDEARVRVAGEWIRDRLARGRHIDACIARAVTEIERSAGGIAISTLRERLGVSKTRLTSGFEEQVGVTPKRFARIVRFRCATAALRTGPDPLARLALRSGYYDQSHMNAEFRELSGLSPLDFLAATRSHATSLAG
ncbi:MAG: helix-turn-helix domain-containing protein [Longimicrobiales bacterium]